MQPSGVFVPVLQLSKLPSAVAPCRLRLGRLVLPGLPAVSRADVLHVPYTETSGESSMTTHPHTTLREVAERIAERFAQEGSYWTCTETIEAALVAERKRTIESVAAHLQELGNKATGGKSWEPYYHCAAIVRALT